MPLQWREQMSVNNLIIDLDHKYLLCLINTVELSLRHPESTDHLRIALEQLSQYAREHFDREERIQYAIKYPQYVEHKLTHQRLLERLAGLTERILVERDDQNLSGDPEELTQLLRDWLLDHVLKEDMKLKPHLSLHPANLLG
ncbi:bacteriohemerythrin [Thioalkalivibrio sp.]|uniref:bacteriohemerythrin n=1 Tax=Thioalkalivibrio sp. TaxID=2093813 RepID=UPI0039760EA7